MPDNAAGTIGTKMPRKWWKLAFFVLLFAFEVVREWAVIENATGAQANAPFHLFRMEGYVVANGRWWRTDGGGKLVPSTVTIECRQETGECVEASVAMFGEYVPAPEMDWFDAQFSPDAVTYLNDRPEWVVIWCDWIPR